MLVFLQTVYLHFQPWTVQSGLLYTPAVKRTSMSLLHLEWDQNWTHYYRRELCVLQSECTATEKEFKTIGKITVSIITLCQLHLSLVHSLSCEELGMLLHGRMYVHAFTASKELRHSILVMFKIIFR